MYKENAETLVLNATYAGENDSLLLSNYSSTYAVKLPIRLFEGVLREDAPESRCRDFVLTKQLFDRVHHNNARATYRSSLILAILPDKN